MSRDGASAIIYVDGAAPAQGAAAHVDPLTSARTGKIGIDDNLASRPFDGEMEFVGVFGNIAFPVEFHKAFHESATDDMMAYGSEEVHGRVDER